MSLANKIVPARSPHAFARVFAREVERRFNQPVRYDAEEFSLAWGDHKSMLRNAYADYLRVPFWQRKAVIQAYVMALLETDSVPSSFDEARASLLPRLMERFSVEHMRLLSGVGPVSPEMIPEVRQLTPDRVMAVVVDTPKAVQYVGQRTLDDWGRSLDDLIPAAMENLWAISKQDFVSVVPGVWMSPYGDTHDASRLILHDLIWQLKVAGQHVAITPNRDTLLVTGSEDESGLLAAMTIAEKVLREEGRPMDGRLLRLEERTWRPWLPPVDTPARAKAEELVILAEMAEYAEQKAALDAIHQQEGKDIFVAEYGAFRLADGRMIAVSVWTDSIPTLLPGSPVVVLNRIVDGQRSEVGPFRWADLRKVCDGLMTPMGLYPERYRVDRLPSDDALAAIDRLDTNFS